MMTASHLQALFVANAVVLITHQIDAAFWHEWEMFRLPGGNQLNLILNLPILALVLLAHREVVRGSTRARGAHRVLAFLGFLTVAVHSTFHFVLGAEQFVQPVSIGLIVATAILSILQAFGSRDVDFGPARSSNG